MQEKKPLSEHEIASTFLSLAAERTSKLQTKSLWTSLSVLIFFALGLAVVVGFILHSDQKTEEATLSQTAELAAQGLQNRLTSTADIISRSSTRLLHAPNYHLPVTSAKLTAKTIMEERPEVMEISVVNTFGSFLRSWTNPNFPTDLERKENEGISIENAAEAFKRSKKLNIWTISAPYTISSYDGVLADVLIPTQNPNQFIIARIDVDEIMRDTARFGISSKYSFSFIDNNEPINKHEASVADGFLIERTIPLFFLSRDPSHEISLAVSTYKYSEFFADKLQFTIIVVLSIILIAAMCMLVYYQRQQSEALNLLNAEYSLRRAMSESAVAGFCVTDKEGKILYVNETFQKLVGYSSSELIKAYPPYPFWKDDISKQMSFIIESDTMLSQPLRFTAVKKNGEVFLADLRISPLIDEEKNSLGYIGALYDVTAETRAQERVEAANERFTRVVESMSASIAVVSRTNEDELLFANRAYERSFGEDSGGVKRILARLSAHKTHNPYNEAIFDETTSHWFDVKTQPIEWSDGTEALMVIMIDITAKREYELSRQAQLKRSEATQRLVTMGEMTSSLAHEINQPLAAAANYAGAAKMLLEAGQMSRERLIEAFSKIENQALRAGKIIQRIRSFSKKTDPKFEVVSINDIIDETMELASIQAEKLHSEVSISIEDGIDKLYCDQVMIEQLLLNLIKNAMEACLAADDHNISLIAARSTYADKEVVKFSVVDHGPGITDIQKERLFDAFYSTKIDGMGMGLNICRRIAEIHEGRLAVSDTPGGGTTFSFTVRTASKHDAQTED